MGLLPVSAFGGLFAFLQDAGRLLYIGQNEWTHVNCALWSAEVFEEEDGSLKNVHVAVIRGKQLVGSMRVFFRASLLVHSRRKEASLYSNFSCGTTDQYFQKRKRFLLKECLKKIYL